MEETKLTNECTQKCKCVKTAWKGFALFLLGVVIGFMAAPIKKGFKICCDNEIHDNQIKGNGANLGGDNDEDDDDDDEDIKF